MASLYLVFILTSDAAGAIHKVPISLLAVVVASHIFLLRIRGVYSLRSRYLCTRDAIVIATCAVVPSLVIGFSEHILRFTDLRFGESLSAILYGLLSSFFMISTRIIRRASLAHRGTVLQKDHRKHVLIVGAGDAGDTVAREIAKMNGKSGKVIGLVDDDPRKRSMRIFGLPVMGSIDDIPALVEKHRIDEVLVAIPSAPGALIKRVFGLCARTNARVRTLPALSDLIEGGLALRYQMRDIRIEDLLRRDPIHTDTSGVRGYIQGNCVLITGGGGSIGSELARQISRLEPKELVLVGKGENSIYEIEQELIQLFGIRPKTVIADVRDRHAMSQVFERFRPTVVFHTAAHKHVPLMQSNVAEAVKNNVIGTLNVADLAVEYGVQKFILISTDKAVRPSSVMGATKRLGEMIVKGLGQSTNTQFSAVRFGNVLGSRGSLIPLLNNQIRCGGPVTVTHRDMTRFFMTIPEAVQLVLQAGSMGDNGDVFILDMGDPVKIEELAVELIRMHGLMPGDDIEVRYTGMRPGEKLHEELVYNKEDLKPTGHRKIQIVSRTAPINMLVLRKEIEVLHRTVVEEGPDVAMSYLMDLVSDKDNPASDESLHGQLR